MRANSADASVWRKLEDHGIADAQTSDGALAEGHMNVAFVYVFEPTQPLDARLDRVQQRTHIITAAKNRPSHDR
jgi:hypothetical protein